MTFDNALKKVRRAVKETTLIDRDSRYYNSWWAGLDHRYRNRTSNPVAWNDLHAKLG